MHFIALLLFLPVAATAPASAWRDRSIYQLLTDRFSLTNGSTTHPCDTSARRYCGGSYRGIINQLNYIQGMGFTAIWISPVVKNVDGVTGWGEGYHGYWAQDMNQLNPHFGTGAELRELSDALHERGMYLMVDVVPNHFGHAGPVAGIEYGDFGAPFNSKDAFHDHCWITDYDDQTMVENCWLGDERVALADVDTSLPWVQVEMNRWVKELVETYQIDGIRIDTAKHMGKPFLSSFASAAGVYSLGEVYHAHPAYLCPYQSQMDGVLNYPMYYALTQAFQSTHGSIIGLVATLVTIREICPDPTLLATFSENHDQARFPSLIADLSLTKNIITYTLISDGIPVIYSGQEHHFSSGTDPLNREALWLTAFTRSTPLYTLISTLNRFRNFVSAASNTYTRDISRVLYVSTSTFALRKGAVVSVFTNSGEMSGQRWVWMAGTGWREGIWVVDVLSCYATKVERGGAVEVRISEGRPRVLFPLAELEGSGICEDVVVPVGREWGEVLARWVRGWKRWFAVGVGVGGKVGF
ncbi:alpha-amylase [Wilcoxina mikolae CBS 423.85]|nr:alpha-amylase [Wilcoxina mikolae CBS 423.85]